MAVVLPLAGCQEVEPPSEPAAYQPATVGAAGDLGVKRVTFTREGAARVGLRIARARQDGRLTVVPYAALIYDHEGATWVYTSPRDLTFARVPVVVKHVEGDRVWLSAGLRGGTRVVTVGAAEVYGAELDISGGH